MPKTPRPKQYGPGPAKRYCFTLNNPTPAEAEHITATLTEEVCEYVIIGRETGEKGTPHFQGFVHLKDKKRFSQVKAMISDRAHVEQARGSNEHNRLYCSKDGDIYLERGIVGAGQGSRSDIASAVEVLRSSGSLTEVAEKCPTAFIRYHRGFSALRDQLRLVKPRFTKTKVTVLVGPPGCGKSKWAAEESNLYSDAVNVFYKARGDWWDGYFQQEVVVIDDFYGWIKYDDMLRLCDRYPLKVQIKGGFQEFNSSHIIITSNKHLHEWYTFNGFDPDALLRRVTSYLDWNSETKTFREIMDCDWETSTARAMYR